MSKVPTPCVLAFAFGCAAAPPEEEPAQEGEGEGEERAPGVLTPLVSPLNLVATFPQCEVTADCDALEAGTCDDVTGYCSDAIVFRNQSFSVRNTGEDAVTVESVAFVGGDADAFVSVEIDRDVVRPREIAFFVIEYSAPDGAEKNSTLTIESDADPPVLEVPTRIAPFEPG